METKINLKILIYFKCPERNRKSIMFKLNHPIFTSAKAIIKNISLVLLVINAIFDKTQILSEIERDETRANPYDDRQLPILYITIYK